MIKDLRHHFIKIKIITLNRGEIIIFKRVVREERDKNILIVILMQISIQMKILNMKKIITIIEDIEVIKIK